MNLKMTYDSLSTDLFTVALQKLTRVPLQVRAALAISELIDDLNKVREKISSEFRSDVLSKYVEKDDKGAFLTEENGNYKIPEGAKADYLSDMEKFGKREIELVFKPIPLMWLSDARGLTVQEVTALKPFIDMNVGNRIPSGL